MNKFKFLFLALCLSLVSLVGFKAQAQYYSYEHCVGVVWGDTYVANANRMRCNYMLTQSAYVNCHQEASAWASWHAYVTCTGMYY